MKPTKGLEFQMGGTPMVWVVTSIQAGEVFYASLASVRQRKAARYSVRVEDFMANAREVTWGVQR